ncbi:MAG: hypothetical protein FH748_11120 [Balneolaceae bacterium]|nr:hypothetical protein [Balneolaceae bacterium]
MMKYIFIFLVPWILFSCKSTKEFTGFSYDPPDVTNTTDKEITPQKKRIIGVGEPVVWVSNMFDGARLSDFYMAEDSVLEAYIKPENGPINNSPWFAFKIWSDTTQKVDIRLNYEEASHRYIPKVNRWNNGKWEYVKKASFTVDDSTETALISITVDTEPVVISAQPLFTTNVLNEELQKRGILNADYVYRREVGKSKQGRPIWEIEINETQAAEVAPVLVILSRQHPPEVSGFRASLFFLEEFTSDSELAKRFRETFIIKAYPMINPDGSDEGHWRHNTGGVDLNRDWVHFNQAETRAVQQALLPLKNQKNRKVFYGIDFHSTNENIFYPILKKIKTEPDDFTQQWAQRITAKHKEAAFTSEEFDTSSPISKNWIFRTFGADAVTYEIHDEMQADDIERLSRSASKLLMEMLLEAWSKTNY